MNITLVWQGPIGPGLFPEDSATLEPFRDAGVYLRLKRYRADRTVSYVGQSVSVLTRIDQHLTTMLSLQAPLRDGHGRAIFLGDAAARLVAYNDVAAAAEAAAAEANRTRFFVALCDEEAFTPDRLDLVEGALKARLEERIASGLGLGACENIQGVPADPFADILGIGQDTSQLAEDDAAQIATLLGTEPIRLDGAVIGAGHAD